MKKILFLTNHLQYSDGVANVLLSLCNNLDTNKYEITVRSLFKYDKDFVSQFNKDIKVESVFYIYFRGLSKLVEKLPSNFLYKLAIKDEYDAEIGFQTGLPTIIVANSNNIFAKHIVWMHGYDYGLTLIDYYKNVDEVICVSKENADRIIYETDGMIKSRYCYNLVDDKKIKKQSLMKISLESKCRPVFVSVGRHSKEKGYVRLVKILSELNKDGYEFECWLVGDGPEHKMIEKEIARASASDFVKLVGADSNPHKYTSKADLFICSSFCEGYSSACTEAAILDVPIITTAVGGAKEIIETAECGMVVALDDESLKDAIKDVLQHPDILDEWKDILSVTGRRFELASRKSEAIDIVDSFFAD